MNKISGVFDLDMSIQYLKGVGPAKSILFNNMNIHTVKDLLEHFPRSYEDRTKLKNINEFIDQEYVLFIGRVTSVIKTQKVRKNLSIHTTFVADDTGICMLNWFNQNYLKNKINVSNEYLFYGKVTYEYGRYVVDNPQIYDLKDLHKVRGIYPIYTLTNGITQNYIFKLISTIYQNNFLFEELFSDEFRKKYDLYEIDRAVKNIHFPENFGIIEYARKRLIFQELFLLQLALLIIKNNCLSVTKVSKYTNTNIEDFLSILPFKLTNAQDKVMNEIMSDLLSDKNMNRLVQGDVGSGKTIIAALAMYVVVKNGYQASMMAPTTILANQHYLELKKYFDVFNVRTAIITSSTTKKQKEDINLKLRNHEIDIIFGTHSLIEDNIEFANLGMVVTDEQHRFGVEQRVKLNNKGKSVEVLIMTATPIPRTLALMLYADLDLSIIDELPPGRKLIKTYAVDKSYEHRINEFIKKQISEGRQAYVVCPLVEENEELNMQSVIELANRYKENEFKDLKVEFLHGKMKNKEKDAIMTKFKEGEINILVSTTVIEVGVNVPNATIMIIENADRFGLAALHQLRGRVGRGQHQSYCILKSNNKSTQALERLKIMEKSNSGFEIAEKDLELRGPGDFFGIRQHGLPEFKLANLLKDVNILKMAGQASKELIANDKNLEKIENKKIREELFNKFGEQLRNIGT
ncbi:MAG: ATP-dependent DNA helicase RecG [Clostridia bacterium]|nr:ATP-dependent DNA helicase RecG [Clostridia bacterium]